MPSRPLEADPDLEAENAALLAYIERLEDELLMLKEERGHFWLSPPELRLTGKESMMLARLLKGGVVSKQQFMTFLYDGRDDPEIKIVEVYICKMRKKLIPQGIEVLTRWGTGYFMAPQTIKAFGERWGLP